MRNRLKALALLGGFLICSPARADDWTLLCQFDGGVETLIQYDAGWPRFSVAVTRGGKEMLVHKALPAGRISTESELLLFVNRDTEPKQERNLFIRLNKETMKARLEAGSGGFDYLAFGGVCREV